MNKIRLAFNAFAVFVLMAAASSVAMGQAQRTWISQATGDDANSCSRTLPCKTFSGALTKTNAGGEINVIDPGSYGTLTITKAITIDGGQAFAGIGAPSGSDAITVTAAANDIVVIRNLTINGQQLNAAPGPLNDGIKVNSAGAVIVENCTITQFTNAGVNFSPTASSKLFLRDVKINNNNRFGVFTKASAGLGEVMITRANLDGNGPYGSGQGLFVSDRSTVTIRDSTTNGNGYAGMYQEANGATTSFLNVENVTSASNALGLAVGFSSGTSTCRLSNTTIVNNTSGGTQWTGGTGFILSFGNNKIAGNIGQNGPVTGLIAIQ